MDIQRTRKMDHEMQSRHMQGSMGITRNIISS